ncbi:MAG: hypothetical protein H8E78_08815 [Proteobacteria bacterium]|nr:hypothetical protein [Pseudomonadota bacterium]
MTSIDEADPGLRSAFGLTGAAFFGATFALGGVFFLAAAFFFGAADFFGADFLAVAFFLLADFFAEDFADEFEAAVFFLAAMTGA